MVGTSGITFSGCKISKTRPQTCTPTSSCCHQASEGTRLGAWRWGVKALPGCFQAASRGCIASKRSSERTRPIACTPESSADAPERIVRLPIFPLGTVVFPATTIPLQIFEARYRVLFSTLLGPDKKGIDEVLVEQESPFLGTGLFGICLSTGDGISRIGATVEIKQHVAIEDGRLLVTNRGRERFRILQMSTSTPLFGCRKVVKEKPVLICDVAILGNEGGSDEPKAMELAEEIADLYRSVMQLTQKMGETSVAPEFLDPEELSTLDASDLSFWIASLFDKNVQEQQLILEEPNICKRLQREQIILKGAEQFLSARFAVKSALTSTPDLDVPPPSDKS